MTEPDYFKSILWRLRQVGRVVLGTPRRRDIARRIPGCDAAVIRVESVMDLSILSKATRLKLIASGTTGINHIDVDAARRLGIRIVYLHGTHTVPTAEHALALLFALARRIPPVQEHMTRGGWERARWIGAQLSGKTIGIVGLGRIGRRVAAFARSIGMRPIAYDPYVRRPLRRRRPRPPSVRMISNLDVLLGQSDVVSIHAALTPETRGMISLRRLRNFKAGAMLVNTARGEIVDSRAMLACLKSGRLAGAALDVYAEEPLPRDSALRAYAGRHPNLILTPHLGASTAEAVGAAAAKMAASVENFFGGKNR